MTASPYSLEEMLLFREWMISTLSTMLMAQNTPVHQFMKEITKVKPASSDEQRNLTIALKMRGGTIGQFNAAGTPLGDNYNTAVTAKSNSVFKKEWGGYYSIARRNKGLLDDIMNILLTKTEDRGYRATGTFQQSTEYDELKNIIIADFLAFKESKLKTLIQNGVSATIYGDTVFATSGTTMNFSNLLTSTPADSAMIDSIYKNFHNHKNERGLRLNYTAPKTVLTTNQNLAEMQKLFNPGSANNLQYQNVLTNGTGEAGVRIAQMDFDTNISYIANSAPGIAVQSDTLEPEWYMDFDHFGNLHIIMSQIFEVQMLYRYGQILIQHS